MKQYIKREFLTLGEIQSIVKVKLPVARLDRVRDIFLFSCFTGLTFDDVDKLKEYNIEVLENGKRLMKIYIPLSNKIREIPLLTIPCMILDKYKGKLTDGKLLPLPRKAAMNYNFERNSPVMRYKPEFNFPFSTSYFYRYGDCCKRHIAKNCC